MLARLAHPSANGPVPTRPTRQTGGSAWGSGSPSADYSTGKNSMVSAMVRQCREQSRDRRPTLRVGLDHERAQCLDITRLRRDPQPATGERQGEPGCGSLCPPADADPSWRGTGPSVTLVSATGHGAEDAEEAGSGDAARTRGTELNPASSRPANSMEMANRHITLTPPADTDILRAALSGSRAVRPARVPPTGERENTSQPSGTHS